MDWWRMEWPFPVSENLLSEAQNKLIEFYRKALCSSAERADFSNFTPQILKIQSMKECNATPQPFHAPLDSLTPRPS